MIGMAAPFTVEDIPDQSGKLILITGGNAGIGYEVAKQLIAKGAHVIIAGRSEARVTAAVAALGPTASGEIVDLASFGSITAFAARVLAAHPRIDTLINNAGVASPPHCKTAEGLEVTLGTNVIGTALITHLLLPAVIASPTGRIVVLSSRAASRLSLQTPLAVLSDVGGEARTSTGLIEYGESKLLNALWAEALQARLAAHPRSQHVLVVSVHPGPVATGIWDKADRSSWLVYLAIEAIKYFYLISVEQGSTSPLFCATAAPAALVPGAMYDVGPQIRLFDMSKVKNYSPANVEAAFVAIDALVVKKGGAAFKLS